MDKSQFSPRNCENSEVSWSGIVLDVSDRNRVETALIEREGRVRFMFGAELSRWQERRAAAQSKNLAGKHVGVGQHGLFYPTNDSEEG